MLVLSRKPQESIQISGDVVITVLAIRGGNVKLGIKAPREMRVIRAELVPAGIRTSRSTLPPTGVPPA